MKTQKNPWFLKTTLVLKQVIKQRCTKFVIFHGSFGNPQENWFPQLKKSLEHLGQEVLVPAFPIDDWNTLTKAGKNTKHTNQNLNNWLITFEKQVLPKIKKGDKLAFIGHSLGPLFILHVISKFNIKLDCAIFVSPFLKLDDDIWQFDTVNETFYKTNFDFKKLKKLIPTSYVLYSDTDPYIGKSVFLTFGKKMHSSTILIKEAGHLNSDSGFTKFPLVFELCKTRLNPKLCQPM